MGKLERRIFPRNRAMFGKGLLRKPLLRREVESLRPPIFQNHLLSGTDSGLISGFRAQFVLGSVENYRRFQRGISPVLDTTVQILIQG